MPSTVSGRGMAFAFAKQQASANSGASFDSTKIVTASQSANASGGSYTAPSATLAGVFWIRWLQGSVHYPDGMYNHEWEGDGSRGESLAYKKFQYGKCTHVCYPRPVELAYLLQAFGGKSSNTVKPVFTGTSTAIAATGSQSFTVTATAGALIDLHVGSVLVFDTGGNQEAVTLTAWNQGTGAGTAVFTKTHAASVAVTNPYFAHTIAYPAIDSGNDYYTVFSLLRGTNYGLQSFDAMCNKLTITATVGMPVKVTSEWVAGGNQFFNGSAVTAVLGGAVYSGSVTNLPTSSDGPYFFLAQSVTAQLFNFSNLSTLNAAVKEFTITMEATLNPEDYQGENVFPLPMVMGNVQVTGDLTILWQDQTAMSLAYFGTSTVTNLAPDVTTATAVQTGFGALALQLVSSTIASAANTECTALFEFPYATYEAVTFEPDLSGKPVEQKMTVHGLKGTPTTITEVTNPVPWAAEVRCAAPAAF